jgi:3-phosphoshikimate 1-carboxyvinyltransferase
LVCLHPEGCFSFDGDEEMRRRPMSGLTEALAGLGVRFDFHGEYGCFPFTVHTAGLPGGRWRVDASASSQMLSALLMVAPLAAAPVQLYSTGARPAFVEMTLQLMQRFGAQTSGSALDQMRVAKMTSYMPPAATFAIEPDVSAASYFISLPLAVGGELFIHGLKQDMLQGDLAFVEVMRHFGLHTETSPDGWSVRYADTAHQPRRFDFRAFSDTFLTLAALAPLLPLPIAIDGIGHTRFQETDRVHAMTAGLTTLGCEVIESDSSLEVVNFNYITGDRVPLLETFRDHRIAMSFAIAGCRDLRGDGTPWLALKDPGCCAKTFPRFFHELESLYLKSHD